MQTENETYLLEGDDWVVFVRQTRQEPANRSILLLHGLKGNETVMWIFSRGLPDNAWIFAPRAILPVDDGYSWIPEQQGWPRLDTFAQPCAVLMESFDRWAERTGAPSETVDVMGFSQGAALCYALAALYPQRTGRVLGLAGFLPVEDPLPGRYSALQGKQVYIAHGTRDETVPVQMAEHAAQTLQSAGADVTFCTSNVGHKLGANCLKGIEEFFSDHRE